MSCTPKKSLLVDASKADTLGGRPSFALSFRLKRLAWIVCWRLLAVWTPRQWVAWRRMLLRLFGAKLASTASIYGSAKIWWPGHLEMGERSSIGPRVNVYSMGPIRIGSNTVISQDAHLCAGTHDIEDPNFQLRTAPVAIGDRVWIAAEAFVGPGARVGDGVVLGARAAAFGELKPWTVYGGNPARPIKQRVMRKA